MATRVRNSAWRKATGPLGVFKAGFLMASMPLSQSVCSHKAVPASREVNEPMLTILRWLLSKSGWLLLSFVTIVTVWALSNELHTNWEDWNKQAESAEKQSGAAKIDARNFREFAQDFTSRKSEFSAQAIAMLKRADTEIVTLKKSSDDQLATAEISIAERQARARAHVLKPESIAWAAVRGKTDKVAASYQAQYIELPLLERTSAFIKLRRTNLIHAASHAINIQSLQSEIRDYNDNIKQYNRKRDENERLRKRAAAEWQNPLCQNVEVPKVCDLVVHVRAENKILISEKRRLDKTRQQIESRKNAIKLTRIPESLADGDRFLTKAEISYAAAASRFSNQATIYEKRADRLAISAKGNLINWVKNAFQQYGLRAFGIVLGAVFIPIFHKIFAFHVIAPLAQTALPIRLHDSGLPLGGSVSDVSVKVPIDRESEMLLRSGYQTSSTDIGGGDKYLLDWGMPLSCLAAGLVNLQRLRSEIPDYVVVTGTDQDHRVATISVPADGAVVLQPRALLGVVKQRGQRLVITRPWRIGRLISWITAQFRYIIFHGPCTLIVQGRNGVEVEKAARGRMVNKRLTLGFDASLAYGAARSASFLPYLYGQASLYNDCFTGTGNYLYEVRDAGPRKGSLWGRGLKGIGDAVLSAFGI